MKEKNKIYTLLVCLLLLLLLAGAGAFKPKTVNADAKISDEAER